MVDHKPGLEGTAIKIVAIKVNDRDKINLFITFFL